MTKITIFKESSVVKNSIKSNLVNNIILKILTGDYSIRNLITVFSYNIVLIASFESFGAKIIH